MEEYIVLIGDTEEKHLSVSLSSLINTLMLDKRYHNRYLIINYSDIYLGVRLKPESMGIELEYLPRYRTV